MTDDTIWKEIADRFADRYTKAEARALAAEAYIAVMEAAIDEAIGADSVRPLLDSYEDRARAVEAHIRTLP